MTLSFAVDPRVTSKTDGPMTPERIMLMGNWMTGFRPTRYPGVFEGKGAYRVRVRAIDPRTGTMKEANRLYERITIKQAVARQLELREELERGTDETERKRVGDFAQLWIKSKAAVVADYTIEGYRYALEEHVLPELGDFFYDSVGHLEVQGMVNAWIAKKKRNGRPYAIESLKDWFRVFRNMTRDAIVQLDLTRDPTLRVSFGESSAAAEQEDTTLAPAECVALLEAMKRKRPGSFVLAKTKSLTGQRFCHVSALRWGDVDFDGLLIHFRRKQVRGVVGAISKKKPVPREIPMLPELADTLRAHKARLEKLQYRVGETDWVFPSRTGGLRIPGSLANAFKKSLGEAGIKKRITPHKLRYFFNDALRLAGVDSVTGRSLTGHVTEEMRRHYSTVRLDEKREAMQAVERKLQGASGDSGGDAARKVA